MDATVMGRTRDDSKIRTCGLKDISQTLLFFLVFRHAILKVFFYDIRRFPLIVRFQ